MKTPIFIIEHLESNLWKWCIIEYKSISQIVGKNNLWFTNIKKGNDKLKDYGKVFIDSLKEMNLKNACMDIPVNYAIKKQEWTDRDSQTKSTITGNLCILDPNAKKTLSQKEARKFDYFIFGGILGDFPPKKRTKELTNFIKNAEARNLGKKQMATDNAVYVVNEIIKGKNMSELKFRNKAIIKINEIESIILPFKYVSINGKPFMSEEIVNYLKKTNTLA